MKKPLKNELQGFYQSKSLDVEQLQELQKIQVSRRFNRRQVLALACSAAVIVLFGGIYFQNDSQSLSLRLADEVAYNHIKGLDPEVSSNDLSVIQGKLSRLDFSLVASANLPSSKWELIGGRYCSIGGRLAAQLKVKEKETGRLYTFYQVQLQEKWDPQKLNQVLEKVKGVTVQFWVEKGVLLALAHSG